MFISLLQKRPQSSPAPFLLLVCCSQAGYLAHEAPFLTWFPMLACAAAAALGSWTGRQRLLWAALGGLASYALTVWQARGAGGAERACSCSVPV